MTNTTASKELKLYIDRYFSLNPRRSRHTLSKKTGVSYSTLSRIMAGQGETSFEQSVKIMREVAVLEELDRFVKKNFPDTYSVLDAFESRSSKFQGFILAASQRLSFEIMTLAYHKVGLSINLVKERYGAYGLEMCRDLQESGILDFDSEHEIYRLNDPPSNNVEIAACVIKSSLDNIFDITKRTTCYHLNWYTERLNHKTCRQIIKILNETDKKIMDLMEDSSSSGDIAFEYFNCGKPTNIFSNEIPD